jgi:methionyl-tRNA formyltransferase
MNAKIIFMGSPEFSLPTLQSLADHYSISGVVTQPDRPAGRGQVLTPPPVKLLAQKLDLPVIQPVRLKDPGVIDQLLAWQPDLIVVIAFGQILRQNILDLPRFGCINVHASLLPRWRGSAPIQSAILAGDEKTGVTIMKMDAGVDTGAVLARRELVIQPEDTAGSLLERAAEAGAQLLIEILPLYISGKVSPVPQDERGATRAPMIQKADGNLDFRRSAVQLERQVRAFQPWPGTFFEWEGNPFKVLKAHVQPDSSVLVGLKSTFGGYPCIGTGDGWLVLDEVQLAGKKPMKGDIFLRGARQWIGT